MSSRAKINNIQDKKSVHNAKVEVEKITPPDYLTH